MAAPGELSSQAQTEHALLVSMGVDSGFAGELVRMNNSMLATEVTSIHTDDDSTDMLTQWMDRGAGDSSDHGDDPSFAIHGAEQRAEQILTVSRLAGALGLRVEKVEE